MNSQTNFIDMVNKAKNVRSKIDKDSKAFFGLLSDGYHNTGGNIKNVLIEEYKGIFDKAFGIGTRHTVDSSALQYFAGDNKDSFHISNNSEEIEQLLIGSCFEGLTSFDSMRDIKFEFIFKNDASVCFIGEECREEMDEAEFFKYLSS